MQQPIELKDGTIVCPWCGEELAGDGENHQECMNCDYSINEADMNPIPGTRPIPKVTKGDLLDALELASQELLNLGYNGLVIDKLEEQVNRVKNDPRLN